MHLSIIIPCYNEAKKIPEDIKAAELFFLNNNIQGEMILVDDGSSDYSSIQAQETRVNEKIEKKVIHYRQNRGKGYAVRQGIAQSQGKYVMFADSGVCIDYQFALEGLKILEAGQADIAHGSRKMAGSTIVRAQTWHRKILSRMFKMFVSAFMGIPRHLTDTQCGFKMYRGDVAREIYKDAVVDGFIFDIEIILRAKKRGYSIAEFPVEWYCDHDTRVTPILISGHILGEFWKIKRSLRDWRDT